MEPAGYILALLVGVSLGLIGGGGSVLTVPLLYYVFGLSAEVSTAWSLFIVGTTSAVGSFAYFRKQEVDIKTAVIFGIPAILSVFATRQWLVPLLPEHFFTLGNFEFTRGVFLITLFALLMIVASVSMIRRSKPVSSRKASGTKKYALILAEGAVVGALTGLVGAGGGFLIIPALVVLGGLEMKKAIGTSLVIIAAKSLIGFLADAGSVGDDWIKLLTITLSAVVGVLIGFQLSKRIPGERLKTAFGWFVLIMGICILITEIL